MKNTFEEVASNRLGVPTIPFPIDDLLHVRGSINIAEILEYLEDVDFEDWLTAALIENASRIPLRHLCVHDAYSSEIGSVDVWLVEITQRTGKIWNGKFQVEFAEVHGPALQPNSRRNTAPERFSLPWTRRGLKSFS
jgi:hypothetical protein